MDSLIVPHNLGGGGGCNVYISKPTLQSSFFWFLYHCL